jgi:endo-1,4-beta-xylanase
MKKMNLLDSAELELNSIITFSCMPRPFKLIRRRHVLMGLASSLIASRIFANRSSQAQLAQVACAQGGDLSVEGDDSLRDRAARKQIIFGMYPERGYEALSKDESFRDAVIQECSLVVGGFCWDCVRPTPDNFDFTEMDAIHNFTRDHDMQFQGGSLVWHMLLPQWVKDKLGDTQVPAQEIEDIFVNYISTSVKRYAGKAHSWIVVNEAIEPKDGRDDALRVTPWLTRLGADYIDLAFRTAAEADPDLLLIYNDYGLEYDTPDDEARRVAVLKLLEGLKSRGTPIHALGIQSHLAGDRTDASFDGLRSFLKKVAGLGLKVFITELDVTDKSFPSDIEVRDRMVAQVYKNYLAAVLEESAVISVINWGLSDRYTWLSNQEPRSDNLPVRPLPLDDGMNRKLAWNGIAQAFDARRNFQGV